jgi:hypothetical protein
MNMLIIGGLAVVAVAAVVGLIFLLMSERRTALASTRAADIPTATALPAVRREPESERDTTPTQQSASVSVEGALPAEEVQHPFPILNGQFHELAAELRTLHQQSEEIERRLSLVNEMIARVEREHSQVGVAAEE